MNDNRPLDVGQTLADHLAERTRVVGRGIGPPRAEFVLYWLHHAMRAYENPALDVAVTLANQLELPLLVYQAIPERYPYASDRHHLFMLEGARDLQEQFRQRGITYALHLDRGNHRGPHLRELCRRAAVAITEEMPVEPLRSWTDRLASTANTPLFSVDTACVVPMQIVRMAYDRAFAFRKATQPLYEQRLHRPWQDAELHVVLPPPQLPFEPLRLSVHDLGQLVSECEIDHAIAPVPHTGGGSTAGYARWEKFKQHALEAYAGLRNNPLIDGTSRLSPYLHYGMISPLRIAREAAALRTPGRDKYLDELLIWRELAYAFCYYRRDHERLAALPSWARETLAEHDADRRPVLHSWETLARGRTGDRLWDAAQRSLLIHGELHNNVRMTWGKALLNWTSDAQSALAMMIDLNHRYALDGQDPASFGGILWCLGQFDRPFPPARPILGFVRDRSTAEHAKRLDPDRYFPHATRPRREPRLRVAVVGAGISGLICARTLGDHGTDVVVFEKSRGAGGRMATRRTAEGAQFDHGAQYLTVRDGRFERYVKSWLQDGIVAPWESRIGTLTCGRWEGTRTTTPRYVGVPGMSAICRHLAADLDIQFGRRVAQPERDHGGWRLRDVAGEHLGVFDCVITSAPAPQSAELLASAPDLQQAARAVSMNGCWAALLVFDRSLGLPFDGAFVHESALSWMARNNSKPQRGSQESWVLHASPVWTSTCLENEPGEALPKMLDAFWQATAVTPRAPIYAACHRWRWALPPEPLPHRCLFDSSLRLGACGDWCSGPRVEGAFLSGTAVAGRVLTEVGTHV
jgi:photolyase PhrII